MREERLLERLRQAENAPWPRAAESPQRAIDSVVQHLQRLLNTRQGSVLIASDYGMPDFTHAMSTGEEAMHEIETAIRLVIEKYEPRLTAIRVQGEAMDDRHQALRFTVQARLRSSARAVLLETSVAPGGKIEVKSS